MIKTKTYPKHLQKKLKIMLKTSQYLYCERKTPTTHRLDIEQNLIHLKLESKIQKRIWTLPNSID